MITFPIGVLTPDAVSFIPNFRNSSGSSSLSGASQVVGSAAGLWNARLVDVALRNAEHVILWETIEILLEGRLNPILVPLMEGRRQPFAPGSVGIGAGIPHSDDTFFSDDTGYWDPEIVANLPFDMPRGATSTSIGIVTGRELRPRDYFSIGDRLYRIKSVEDVSGSIYTVKFWPRAREAAPAGTIVEFDKPVCKMRLKTDTEMAIDKSLSKFASATIEFVEDLS